MRHYPARKPRNPAGHWSANRDRQTQAAFRAAVLANADGQCEGVDDGERCPITAPLQAHHTQEGNDDPATGRALCARHHKLEDPHAR